MLNAIQNWLQKFFTQLSTLFAHTDNAVENKRFGLGQFVLLLTLVPFIFNLTLYSIGDPEPVPSNYEPNVERFEPLPIYLKDQGKKSAPSRPNKPRASAALNKCNRYPLHQLLYPNHCHSLRHTFNKKKRVYAKKKRQFDIENKAYIAYQKEKKNYRKNIDTQYQTFDEDKIKSNETIVATAHAHTDLNSIISHRLAGNDWLKITFPLWLLGACLIVPTILLSIKRQLWGLVAIGLAIPCFNYFVTFPSKLFGYEFLASWEITSLLVPQMAFIWFIFKGHIRSKSYIYFTFLLIAITLTPKVTAIDASYSILQAQLPIIAFILASCMGRLLVKIVQENHYLFRNLGWKRSLLTLAHSLLLWLPIALTAIPFFYITEVVFPKHVVNQLNAKDILRFDHQHDFLDNTLQSSAIKADDAIYHWYITTQLLKKDIYTKSKKLKDINLKQAIQQTFDRVVPEELVFDQYESDAGFIKEEIVEISVDAAQNQTSKAYLNLRGKLRAQLSRLAQQHGETFKAAVKKGEAAALQSIDNLYLEGVDSLLETNRATQGSLWWSINYVRAAHQVSILIFIFICLKSLMYVFARVSFNRDTGTFVTLGNVEVSPSEVPGANISRTGLQYLISGDKAQIFYISRRFQCRGKPPKFTIPQALRAPFARLFNGAYSMNKVIMAKGDDTVSCTAAQGIEFFEWDLREGESIVFDFHNFVGMSESVTISTLISTRISSLLIGHMIYSQATGPGKLILMAKGRAEISDVANNAGSLPPERLIAMQTNTRFHVDSELDIVNIYLSNAYVRPAGNGQVIVDVDSQRGNKTGLVSFLKRFILPV